jgi:hypothetical protein
MLINYCRACLDYLVLRIGTSRRTDRANDFAPLDQGNAASERDDSVECEQPESAIATFIFEFRF